MIKENQKVLDLSHLQMLPMLRNVFSNAIKLM